MSSPLKNLYSPAFYNRLCEALSVSVPSFDSSKFTQLIYTDAFETMELKERMKHTTRVLHHFLPDDYEAGVSLIYKTIETLRKRGVGEDGLANIFLPDYIETYGLDHFQSSVEALEFITQFVSCEFAVRPFILKYGTEMIRKMEKWALHPNYKVRRLASEGSRPRLPWAMGIPFLKKDPSEILPILEHLKNDPSEWVRRSVANNLNDIAKDHPGVVFKILKSWTGISKETDAILKHGSRTLLKQGHADVLKHYGLDDSGIKHENFRILNSRISIGDSLEFEFLLRNENSISKTVRLEYAIYYQKQNGQLNKKVYKISERMYPSGTSVQVNRKQKFVLITTRKFHTGLHRASLIINGSEKESLDFELV